MKWLEIDMGDSAEEWDAFYREIEAAVLGSPSAPVPSRVGADRLESPYRAYRAEGGSERGTRPGPS